MSKDNSLMPLYHRNSDGSLMQLHHQDTDGALIPLHITSGVINVPCQKGYIVDKTGNCIRVTHKKV